MLPSEVIVETVEVALSRPTLVVRFDNVLLFTVPVIGYDAAEVYLYPPNRSRNRHGRCLCASRMNEAA